MITISPKQRRFLMQVIPFGMIWGLFGVVYAIVEYGIMGEAQFYPSTANPYSFERAIATIPITAIFLGFLFGAIEVNMLNSLFKKRPFWQMLVFKTGFYMILLLFMMVITGFVINSIIYGLPPTHPKVVQSVEIFTSNFVFISIVIYISVFSGVAFYLYEISGYLGRTVINNFFTGRYHQPRQEERIFMFLDMKDSTQIAEQLGHIQYFKLLNQYFADLSDAILNTSGAVYQYAGDEVIVTWDLPTGTRNNNCIRCFFMIKEILHSLSGEYLEEFGLVPQFKAGFHQGEVTTGEIGVLKKEIFFTGDVINTAARIQSLCNNMGKTILVSEDLIDKLDLSNEFVVIEMGEQELKGKQSKVKLFTLEPLHP